jgi:alpha-tubulin suppressor-like RCC1 family protein
MSSWLIEMDPTVARYPAGMRRTVICALLVVAAIMMPGAAVAESSSSLTRSFQAGMIDSGYQHGCAVLATGTAMCWGKDDTGQLGNGATTGDQGLPNPVALAPPRRAVSISAGWEHSCAVLDNGTAACWGSDTSGRLGNGAVAGVQEVPSAVDLPVGRRATAISAGFQHSCAILDDGSAMCWGADASGQLGNGPASAASRPQPEPVSLPVGSRAIAITAGFDWSCAVLDDGELRCWGEGAYDGISGSADQATPTVVPLPSGRRAVGVSAADFHSCVVLDDGAVRCWGLEIHGELGDGMPVNSTAFTPVGVLLPAGAQAIAVGAGRQHSCAVLSGGEMACWGLDAGGPLGDGGDFTDPDQPAPVAAAIPFGRQVVALGTGGDNSCALLDDGSLWCWGLDTDLQVGDGNVVANQFSPVLVLAPLSFAGKVVDVSLTLDGTSTSLLLGQPGTGVVRVVNSGPDPVDGVVVALSTTNLGLSGAVASQGALAGDGWQVGRLGTGAQALLTLDLGAASTGAASFGAQLTAAAERDPDSTPGNNVAGEDDQASATIQVIGPPAAPSPPPPGPSPNLPPKARPDRITISLLSARDRIAPHVFTVRGRLVASGVAAAFGCRGRVTVTGTAGRRVLARRQAPLRLVDGACEYKATLKISNRARRTARSMRVTASFAGNNVLLARSSVARVARLT